MDSSWGIDPVTHRTMSGRSTTKLMLKAPSNVKSFINMIYQEIEFSKQLV